MKTFIPKNQARPKTAKLAEGLRGDAIDARGKSPLHQSSVN
jgi:hypothetical protein